MEMTPARFFEKGIPAMVLKHFDDFLEEQGVLAFEVRGEGEWSVRFGDPQEPVAKGKPERFDLFLSFSPEAFKAFISGTLDLPKALGAKELIAKGTNFMLLESFGELIAPPKASLGWEASTVG